MKFAYTFCFKCLTFGAQDRKPMFGQVCGNCLSHLTVTHPFCIPIARARYAIRKKLGRVKYVKD